MLGNLPDLLSPSPGCTLEISQTGYLSPIPPATLATASCLRLPASHLLPLSLRAVPELAPLVVGIAFRFYEQDPTYYKVSITACLHDKKQEQKKRSTQRK